MTEEQKEISSIELTESLLELIQLKDGKETSELLVLVINTVGMLLISIGVITSDQLAQFMPITLLGFLFVMYLGKVYIDWRGKLKIKHMEVNTKVQPLTIINN